MLHSYKKRTSVSGVCDFIYSFNTLFLFSGISAEYQIFWSGPGLGPTCLQRLSADGTVREKVKYLLAV